ncbi:transposase [Clostridium thermarum]|uniref:transposase n=1 Tax=Clostridium thermarum TaxID=1716543 RepID=UPI00111CBA64|nr:transposase [Clostridium thermarum]
MFCRNNVQQTSLLDPIAQMPKYLQDILKKSWAQAFRDQIFPLINEDRFSVIYSCDQASRPNTPVNVIIGLLMIKEIFQQSDEELIGSLHFDKRYQYALCTTNYDKQPVSINTLTNFRNRVIDYE